MSDTESPAEVMRRAAVLMRKRAEEATPGPWERPLDTRYKSAVIAALPDDEEGSYRNGMIPAEFASHKGPTGRYAGQRERVGVVSASTWSVGGFTRKRSGRDLEHVASWDPVVAAAVADLLEEIARQYDAPPCDSPAGVCNGCERREDFNDALRLARAYLGVTS